MMRTFLASNLEDRLLKKALIGSTLVHLSLPFIRMPAAPIRNLDIESESIAAELIFEQDDVADVVPPKEAEKVPMLPQLPKKFQVVEPAKEDPLALEVADETSKHDLQKKKMLELSKAEALKRLKREQIRRKKLETMARKSQKEIDAMTKSLAKKKESLAGSRDTIVSDATKTYRSILRRWVESRYELPTVYQNLANMETVVELKLSAAGDIVKMEVLKPSAHKGFDALALKTLKESAPFPKPPVALVGAPIRYRFNPKG